MKTKYLIILLLAMGLAAGCHHNDYNDDPEDRFESEFTEMEDMMLLASLASASTDDTTDPSLPAENPSLTNIILEGASLSPAFQPGVYFYTTTYPLAETTARITIVPADNSWLIKLNGYAVLPGQTYLLPLVNTEEIITVEVSDTNADGGNPATYTILINRV